MWGLTMRRHAVLAALILAGIAFLTTALIGLPQDPTGMGVGLKIAIIGSAVAFMLMVVLYVLRK